LQLPVGVYSAICQDTPADYVGRTLAVVGMAMPNFWLALMVIIYPAIWWGWSPPTQVIPFFEDPLGNLGQYVFNVCGTFKFYCSIGVQASLKRSSETVRLPIN